MEHETDVGDGLTLREPLQGDFSQLRQWQQDVPSLAKLQEISPEQPVGGDEMSNIFLL